MATTTNTFVREVSNNNSQGTRLGQSDNDLISFYGAAPVANATIVGSNTLSTAVSSNDAFGFGDATTASTIVAICNRLVTLGLIN
jgi:hypothetical protein